MNVRDSNQAVLKGLKKKAEEKKPEQIQVNHGNAPILSVKFLELIHLDLIEIKELLKKNG